MTVKLKSLRIHVTPQQQAQIVEAAHAAQKSISTYVRDALADCGIVDAPEIPIQHGGKRERPVKKKK